MVGGATSNGHVTAKGLAFMLCPVYIVTLEDGEECAVARSPRGEALLAFLTKWLLSFPVLVTEEIDPPRAAVVSDYGVVSIEGLP